MSSRVLRCALAAAIVAGHALALFLALMRQPSLMLPASASGVPPVYVEDLSAALSARGGHRARGSAAPGLPANSSAGASRSPHTLTAPPATAAGPIAWDLDTQAAVGEVVSGIARGEKRKCRDAEEPDSWLPKCITRPPAFQWSAEPRRAGFAHGIPYLRLAERCVLVLGLLGCELGARLPPNGHLFDDLHDPDRYRSSAPDWREVNEPVALAARRPSVVVNSPVQ
jgi:hypothetical protein